MTRAGRAALSFEVKPTHVLPAALQTTIFAYWALYFPDVVRRVPWILGQLLVGYALDAATSLAARRKWTVGFGPVPVVFSLNLFLWPVPGREIVSVAALVVAFGSKAFLRRGGRHVMNPSAFGAAVVGASALAWPETVPYVDIAHEFTLPPNMTEVILLLALIPQTRLPIVMVSVGAVAAVECCNALVRTSFLGLSSTATLDALWPPVFLAMTLLASDPATIPRSTLGRLFAGLSFGALVFWTSAGLVAAGQSDYFAKVLPLPVMNLLVPTFDRAAAAIVAWAPRLPTGAQRIFGRFGAARLNALFVAAFVLLVATRLHGRARKAGILDTLERDGLLHAHGAPPHAAGPEACLAHPPYCRPFSFRSEWSALGARARWVTPDLPPDRTEHAFRLLAGESR